MCIRDSGYTGTSGRPVIWQEGTMMDLGDIPGGGDYGYVWALNGDGSVAVGYADTGTSNGAMIWDAVHGIRSIADVLDSVGVDVSEWQLSQAMGVSADGKVVGGVGYNITEGRTEGWVAHLP